MGDKSGIEWTDATWNPTVGCTLVSPGCTNCYAMGVAWRNERMGSTKYQGTARKVNDHPVWTGKVKLMGAALDQPLRWKRPRRIFVNSMSDLFHEALTDAEIDQVFAVMALCPQHTFQVLTKRARRMRDYAHAFLRGKRNVSLYMTRLIARTDDIMSLAYGAARDKVQCEFGSSLGRPLPNVWLGVSVEDQARADERIPLLLQTPAAVRFLSCEPLLGPVDLARIPFRDGDSRHRWDALSGQALMHAYGIDGHPDVTVRMDKPISPHIDWVIAGGESGPGARPMPPDWARSLRDHCAAAGVPFFFKQWGEFLPEDDAYDRSLAVIENGPPPDGMYRVGKARAGRALDGRTHDEFPR
jgi:protein gp37